jgi:hypothetical protein
MEGNLKELSSSAGKTGSKDKIGSIGAVGTTVAAARN